MWIFLGNPVHRVHIMPVHSKNLIRQLFISLVERGVGAPLTETCNLLKLPMSTVSDIIHSKPGDLKRKRPVNNNVRTRFSESEKKFIRDTVYSIYEKNQVATLDNIKAALREKEFPFPYSNVLLSQLLHTIGFKYRKINKRTKCMNAPRLLIWRIEYINKIRTFRSQRKSIYYFDETW